MRVVYVDDDELLLEVASVFLADHGMIPICVKDSRMALDTVFSERPDIVLLDVMMPEPDGPATLRRLREQRAFDETSIVFVTADAEVEEVRALMALGADGVIAKPFSPGQLAGELSRIHARRQGMRKGEPRSEMAG